MTTVWYGDMYPITQLGRIFWSVIVFLWPVLLALFSAVTIMVFKETDDNHKLAIDKNKSTKKISWLILCNKCNSRNINEANYCSTCWKKLLWN